MARKIKDKEDYKKSLEKLDLLMDAKPGTSRGRMLDQLASRIEEYEKEHYFFEDKKTKNIIKLSKLQLLVKYFKSFW